MILYLAEPGMKFRSLLILFFCIVSVMPLFTEAQVTFQNYTSNTGLPSDEVYCLHQDKLGYIWVGTDHGLVRYNGLEFTAFTTFNGLTDNTVFSIREDDKGRLWCLTFGGGICYYERDTFYAHPLNDSIKPLLREKMPSSWHVANDGVIWFGMTARGICKITNTGIQKYYNIDNKHYRDDIVVYEIDLNDGGYIFTSLNQNASFNFNVEGIDTVKAVTISRKDFSETTRNFSLLRVSANSFIVAQWNLLIYVSPAGTQKLSWPDKVQIVQTKKTADGKIWVLAQNSVLYQLSVSGNRISLTDSLNDVSSVTDVLVDRQGMLWASTLENGVYVMPNRQIRCLQLSDRKHDKVISMTVDSNYLYAGLTQNRVAKIDTRSNWNVIRNSKFPNDVAALLAYNGNIWTNADVSSAIDSFLFVNTFSPLKGSMFLAGGGDGFGITDGRKGYFYSRNIGFTQRVTALCALTDSLFVIGTLNGLYTYHLGANKPVPVEGFKDIRISFCQKLHNGNYVVGTKGSGVYIGNGRHGSFIRKRHGLVSEIVEDIYVQSDSVFWVASYKGLSRVVVANTADTLTCRVNVYTREDGLYSNQINEVTFYNGQIWLATNEGLCRFNVADLKDTTEIVPLYFAGVFVNGKKSAYDNPIFNYDENNLIVKFNALYYRPFSTLRYKVKLNDDGIWEYTNLNYAQFFNLPPGEYKFYVAAEGLNNKYISDVKVLRFTIKPHFTQTAWFTAMWVITIIGSTAMLAYVFLRYQRNKAENTIRRLHAEFKALNYQINPHFVFNVLNSIQYFIVNNNAKKAAFFLNSFSSLIRQIVSNSRQQYISLLEEVNCLKEYMDLEKLRLDNRMEYEINLSSEVDIAKKQIPPMIVQPLVENAIWHGIAPLEGKGKVVVSFYMNNDTLFCTVDDNGVGLGRKKPGAGGNNLSIASDNVKERLKITAEINDSSWELTMVDKSVKQEDEKGTLVTVKFPRLK